MSAWDRWDRERASRFVLTATERLDPRARAMLHAVATPSESDALASVVLEAGSHLGALMGSAAVADQLIDRLDVHPEVREHLHAIFFGIAAMAAREYERVVEAFDLVEPHEDAEGER